MRALTETSILRLYVLMGSPLADLSIFRGNDDLFLAVVLLCSLGYFRGSSSMPGRITS